MPPKELNPMKVGTNPVPIDEQTRSSAMIDFSFAVGRFFAVSRQSAILIKRSAP